MIQLVLSVWPQDAEKPFLPFPVSFSPSSAIEMILLAGGRHYAPGRSFAGGTAATHHVTVCSRQRFCASFRAAGKGRRVSVHLKPFRLNTVQVLQIWDFIQRYHKIVRLSPFSLEDLAGAVCYPTETPLATEFHCAFLRYLLHQSMEVRVSVTAGDG